MFAHVPHSIPIHICQIFCDEDGQPNLAPEAGLHLQLQDFAGESLVEEYEDLHDPIFIPSTALHAYLVRGETVKWEHKQRQSYKSGPRPDKAVQREYTTGGDQGRPRGQIPSG